MKKLTRITLLFALAIAIAAFFKLGFHQYISLEYIKSQQLSFENYYRSHPMATIAMYFGIYVLITSLSLPGAAIATLAGGALFGVAKGTVIVSFASTLGASLAFLLARFVLRDWVENRFSDTTSKINQGIEKEGAFYLFTLRLIPAVPFFVINLAMGLTKMRLPVFWLVSQVGMLAGTFVYVNAGTQLAQLETLAGILSPRLLAAFSLLGVFPFVIKGLMAWIRTRKAFAGFSRPARFEYNIVVVGGGSAGLVTSYIGAAARAKVALIEKHKLGGDCLNTGCVPSKALLRSAKFKHEVDSAGRLGFESATAKGQFSDIMARVHRVIKKIEPHDSAERYQELGVDVIQGEARILSPWIVQVGEQILTTKNIVIATGARPFVPPIKNIDQVDYLTSDTVWNLQTLPPRLVVLGGGPIGCELTQAFARLGSQVTQVELGPRIMPREDEVVSELVRQRFAAEGITVLTDHLATAVEVAAEDKFLVCTSNNQTVRIPFDQLLVAVGRTANTTGFGLEELGIEIGPRGTVAVDEYLRTNIPSIFAAGDVAGPYQFTHTAAHMAYYCAVNAMAQPFYKAKVDYSVIPWATFTDPEVARVGLNEQEAQQQNIAYDVSQYGIDDLDRAIADEAAYGFVRVLTEPASDRILGVTIAGIHAGELLGEYVLAMRHGIGLNKILSTIHIYPTLAESNKFVAGVWKRSQVSEKTLAWGHRINAWRRK